MNCTHIQNNQALAVCIHASASTSRQWSKLVADFACRMRTITPDLIGYGDAAEMPTDRPMRMEDEVENILRQIREQTGKDNGPLHLIGHSYGGAIALQIALMYPERVASLTLYEPAQFLLLFQDGLRSSEAQEILSVHRYVQERKNSWRGRRAAAKHFIEYWSGKGIWSRFTFKQRRRFVRLLPKVAAEFNAIFSALVTVEDCARLTMPIRLICGTRTRASASGVTRNLTAAVPNAECFEIDGADHMAAATQPAKVNPLILEHVFACAEVPLRAAA